MILRVIEVHANVKNSSKHATPFIGIGQDIVFLKEILCCCGLSSDRILLQKLCIRAHEPQQGICFPYWYRSDKV
jgi:hypothetical protein